MFALLKIAAIFAIVTGLLRLKAPLWASFLAGALAAGLLFGLGPAATAAAVGKAAIEPDTLRFVLVVGLVLALSLTLKAGAQIERITETLRSFMPNRRFLAAALPAIVGLLPMPGGALFSAPMVEAVCGQETPAGAKIGVNHWFRHVWEYTWPLYPGLIAAVELAGVPMKTMVTLMSPLTLIAAGAGIVFLLRKIPKSAGEIGTPGKRLRSGAAFLFEMSPFFAVIAVHIFAGLPLTAALGVGIGWSALTILARRKAGPAALGKAVFANLHFYDFLLMAAGVKVFAAALKACGALDQLGQFFSAAPIPALAVVCLLPFVGGLISGITVVYVTTSFPVLLAIPAVAADPLPYMIVAYAAGFAGTLVSPLHVCFVLGCRYFKDPMSRNALAMAIPSAFVMAAAFGLFALYRNWNVF